MSDVAEQTDAPVEEAVEQVTESPQPVDEALEADLTADVIEVPDSSAVDGTVKLVPLAAVTKAREALKTAKAELQTAKDGSAKAQQLEQRIDQLSQQIAQLGPKAQAYDAAVAAQQQQPRQVEPQDDTEAIDFATALDLYTAEGKPDVTKARKILGVVDARAGHVAQRQIQPLAQHTVQQQSQSMLARAKVTTLPNGEKPDPATLEAIWSRLDPALTATKEGAQQAYIAAMGYSRAMGPSATSPAATRGADGKFAPKADLPAPLHTEKAGGRDLPSGPPLSDKERKYLKDAGISEKEYHESANSAPWLRR